MASQSEPVLLLTGPSDEGWHSYEQAIICLQLYAFEYRPPDKIPGGGEAVSTRERREERNSPALVKGTLFHLVLAHHYRRMQARQEGEDEEGWYTPEDALQVATERLGHQKYRELIQHAYEVYQMTYWDDEDIYRILAVEEVRTTWVGPHRVTGRLDLVWEDLNGNVQGVDTKTTGRITKKQRQYYSVSGQLIGYDRMIHDAFPDQPKAPFLVNLVELSENARCERMVRSPAPNLYRGYDTIIADTKARVAYWDAKKVRQDAWPKATSEHVCHRKYGSCAYLEACAFGNVGAPPAFVFDRKSFMVGRDDDDDE